MHELINGLGQFDLTSLCCQRILCGTVREQLIQYRPKWPTYFRLAPGSNSQFNITNYNPRVCSQVNFTCILLHVAQFPATPLLRSTYGFNSEAHKECFRTWWKKKSSLILPRSLPFASWESLSLDIVWRTARAASLPPCSPNYICFFCTLDKEHRRCCAQ